MKQNQHRLYVFEVIGVFFSNLLLWTVFTDGWQSSLLDSDRVRNISGGRIKSEQAFKWVPADWLHNKNYLENAVFYWTQIRSLPCLALSLSEWPLWILLQLLDLSKLLHGFVEVVLCISCRLPNKAKLKFEQDFKAFWSFCIELKMLNESKHSMHWVFCAFGYVS